MAQAKLSRVSKHQRPQDFQSTLFKPPESSYKELSFLFFSFKSNFKDTQTFCSSLSQRHLEWF